MAKSMQQRVMAACPKSPEPVATQASMSERQLAAFDGTLIYWCPACRAPHQTQIGEMTLAPAQPGPLTGLHP